MKFSLTISGIAVLVVSQVLGDAVTESEVTTFIEVAGLLIGTVMGWYGRFRHGDVDIFGRKD